MCRVLIVSYFLFLLTLVVRCEGDTIVKNCKFRQLPEEFSNGKLPNKDQKTDRSLPYLGRIREQPNGFSIRFPEELKTEFAVFTRTSKANIVYKPQAICDSQNNSRTYPYNLNQLMESGFNPQQETIIVIDGFNGKAFNEWQTKIKDYWLSLGNFNVILVGWDGGSQASYPFSVGATKVVGRKVSVLLYYIAKLHGFELDDDSFLSKFHIVGFSLGAHIAGYIGYDLGGKIQHITGLDPAGPGYDGLGLEDRLDRNDAQLVDALHTNSGHLGVARPFYGTTLSVGHIDFHVNDGKTQPGCQVDFLGCSHKVAKELYLEILKHTVESHFFKRGGSYKPHRFLAVRSSNYGDFRDGTSFLKYCPSIVNRMNSSSSNDLNNCIVPIDLLGGAEYRKELENSHNVKLDSELGNKYYFITEPEAPYIRGISLLKMSVYPSYSKKVQPIECDITVITDTKRLELEAQRMIPINGHYEIAIPDLEPGFNPARKVIKFDASSDESMNFKSIFPMWVELSSKVSRNNDSSNEPWYFGKDLIDLLKGRDGQGTPIDNGECNLKFNTLSIEPIRNSNRLLIGVYGQLEEKNPKMVILERSELKPDILEAGKRDVGSKLYLNKVLVVT